jgi:hypothetical protein
MVLSQDPFNLSTNEKSKHNKERKVREAPPFLPDD